MKTELKDGLALLKKIKFSKDYEKFKELCDVFKFKQIEKSKNKWYNAFFQESRLLELLS